MGLNYWLYRAKYKFARELNLNSPVDVSLELASECNQACSYCYHADQKRLPFTKGMMDFDLACKVIDDAYSLGVNSLKFNYRGESTLHASFSTLTYQAKRYAKGSTFIDRLTNSNFKFLTDRDDIFQGLSYQTKVKVSLDSFVPGVMHKQRAGSNLDLAISNIDKFYNWPGRTTKIVIQAVRTQLNKDEDIAGEVKRRWPDASVSINDMVGGRVGKDISKLEVRTRPADSRQSCIQAHARLIVNWDGKVTVCCPDIGSKLIVGDANTMSLSEIWNGEPARQIRQSLLDRTAFENNPCKTCPSHESYGGYKAKWDS